jgi:Arc/MetJ-type ribon-helix-helix transcriptional regulator
VSLRLHASVADAIRSLVDAGEAPSADAFIESAVVAELRERRRRAVYAAYEQAAADPVFIAEMGRVAREFDGAVGDGLTTTDGY